MIELYAICVVLICSKYQRVNADFTPDFNDWLIERFGSDVQTILNRGDLGDRGSFGGKAFRSEKLRNQPIIFVHGVSDTAHDKPFSAAKYFKENGYEWSELYGTTYANGAQGNPLQWTQYAMRCSYVKQVRALIVAVRLYTGRAIDVVAYSLGVPISRKAILGGRCVDTEEDLGKPLTRFIDTFVGVAGPNHGISPQIGGISIPACIFTILPVCNTQTGLYSGVCPAESLYLQDINSRQGYEAQNVFSIYSKADQIVGYMVCDKITTQVPGQRDEKVYMSEDHEGTFYHSYEIQRQMVLNHVVA